MEKPNLKYADSVASRQFVYELLEIMISSLLWHEGVDGFRRRVAASDLCIPVQEETHDGT